MPALRVLLWQESHWWVAQCLDVDVATQGGSPEEALANMSEALVLHHSQPCGRLQPAPASTAMPRESTEAVVNIDL